MASPRANPLNEFALTGRSDAHVAPLPGSNIRLHPEAAAAFVAMRAAARADGLELLAASGFRDFDRQLSIWNGKFRGERPVVDAGGRPLDMATLDEPARVAAILAWSALPGASRHHWGTDLDVIDAATLPPGESARLEPVDFAPGGRHAALEDWLARHAEGYGFFRPYDRDRGGTRPEPWHLSWAPLATAAQAALTPALLARALEGVAIEGRTTIGQSLDRLHAGYVVAVAAPPAAALAAARRSPSARPA